MVGHGLGGCGTTSGAAGLGEACSVATDCAPGLVCVVQKNGGRVCSDDLSGVLGKPPGSDDGTTDEADAGEDGGAPDDASPGEPDASTPDAGEPEEDAATPDAGEPEPDGGPPDAGQEPDAGEEPEPDAGDPG